MGVNRYLGDFLKARRHALDPSELGLPVARRRRTKGLRREEVAERAGISTEWYTKLEQGRDVSPSSETVSALAAALALTSAETAHLRRLFERRPSAFERETVPPAIASLVERLSSPAYVTGERWDILAWNAGAEELFEFSRLPEDDRNILFFMFQVPLARSLFRETWAEEGKRLVALFRATHDQHAGNADFTNLIARLLESSMDFRTWWSSHDVRLPSAGVKTFYQADGVATRFCYATFQSNDNPSLKLAIYDRAS